MFVEFLPVFTNKTGKNTYSNFYQPTQQKQVFVRKKRIHATQCTYNSHVSEQFLKEGPDVVVGVDVLHLHLSVNVAVTQEVHVDHLYLRHNSYLTSSCRPSLPATHQLPYKFM